MALIGDTKFGLYGLINHPNVPLVVGLHGDWMNPDTTADQMLADLDMIYDAVPNQSKDPHLLEAGSGLRWQDRGPVFPGQAPRPADHGRRGIQGSRHRGQGSDPGLRVQRGKPGNGAAQAGQPAGCAGARA
ncbi:hypothetical protein G6F59_017551 [Rhizopus arrhizus]|nr:hypothetical protein G6F59_017551 [Rhizopus arrhizus]